MGRDKKNIDLGVYFGNALVGVLCKESSGLNTFRYTQEWINDGFAISHSLALIEDEYSGDKVAFYFENLLPDNDFIRKSIATKFGAKSTKAFDLLYAIGRDCVGALSFIPLDEKVIDPYVIEGKELSAKEIATRVKNLSGVSPLGMDDRDFRISIAGAQEKTALLRYKNKWLEPLGMTATTHIIKTSIGALGVDVNFEDSIDNEWASLYLMRKLGLKTCHSEILNFESTRVLAVERFDREFRTIDGTEYLLRLPQEDMCQAFGVSPYQKYQSDGGPGAIEIMKFLAASTDENDRLDFLKAMLVFDLLYATDGHAKNFSIFLTPTGFKLTPFYDVMSGYFLHAREKQALQKLKLAMKWGDSGHYNFKRIQKRHYIESAHKAGINKEIFEKVHEEMKEAFENLHINDKELDKNLNHETLNMILEGMKKRASVLF